MIKKYLSYLYNRTAEDSTRYFLSLFESKPGAKVLDCGCWDGANTLKYGKIIGTKEVYGIEINKLKAKEAEKKGVKVKVGNLNEKLPFQSNAFDAVVAYHVIEHLVNARGFAAEINRVLKKNGYVVIGTPNLASWHNILALLIGVQPFSGPTIMPNYESEVSVVKNMNKKRLKEVFSDEEAESLEHIKIMTLKALISLLKANKFRIENAKGFGYYPLFPLLSKPLSLLDPYHSHYVIVKARKI